MRMQKGPLVSAVETCPSCSRWRDSVLECASALALWHEQATARSRKAPEHWRTPKPGGASRGHCEWTVVSRRLAVVLLGLISILVGCGRKHEPQAAAGENLPPAAVRVQTIEAVKQPVIEEVVGTVQPKLQAVIEAKVSGRITRLPVTLGQAVKQGDALVELATQEVQARLDQANAAFRQAELDFNRTENLRKQQAATQGELDAAQARYNVAKAAVAEAEALSGYAKLLAPFDGVVAR